MTTDPAAPLDKRGQFIAARKHDLFVALAHDALRHHDPATLEQLYRLITATVHYEHLGARERLHDAYHYLNPAARSPAHPPEGNEASYHALSEALDYVLRAANFVELTPAEIEEAHAADGRVSYSVRARVEDFRAIRVFSRGHHAETVEIRSWFGLRRREMVLDVFDEVVLFAGLKPTPPPPGRFRRRAPVAPPGSVMIKAFHNIARGDLDTLFPNARVVLNNKDMLVLGVPALLGGIPILLRLAPAVLVLYGLVSFYVAGATPGAESINEALLVAGALVALGGFLMNQWVKYERRALRYQKEVNDKLYFRNVTNNIGVIDHIIGMAEEQDCKEALLAYGFLLADGPLTELQLDLRIEEWLAARFGIDVDFEVTDALAKLDSYGVLVRTGEMLSVLQPRGALAALDRRWDSLFDFTDEPVARSATG